MARARRVGREPLVDWGKVGSFLEQARRKAGFATQEALAVELERDQAYVSRHESGDRSMTLQDFLDWCQTCKADPRWCFDALGVTKRRKRKSRGDAKKPRPKP